MNGNIDNLYVPTQNEYDYLLLKSLKGESLTYYEQELMHKFEEQEEKNRLAAEGLESQKILKFPGNKQGTTEIFDFEDDDEQVGAISSIIIILIVLCVGLFAAFVLLGFIS